jgi:hypothetical protein
MGGSRKERSMDIEAGIETGREREGGCLKVGLRACVNLW